MSRFATENARARTRRQPSSLAAWAHEQRRRTLTPSLSGRTGPHSGTPSVRSAGTSEYRHTYGGFAPIAAVQRLAIARYLEEPDLDDGARDLLRLALEGTAGTTVDDPPAWMSTHQGRANTLRSMQLHNAHLYAELVMFLGLWKAERDQAA
jgi:hypothetical protein